MNVVLYTHELEPITILDLPVWLLEQLEKTGAVRIAVVEPPGWVHEEVPVVANPTMRTVTIYCEKLRWHNNQTKTILVTPDEELALTLHQLSPLLRNRVTTSSNTMAKPRRI